MSQYPYRSHRKSLLFCPALNSSLYNKALRSEADSIIFDLEDSIDVSAKTKARMELEQSFPRDYQGKKELMIRVNNPRSPHFRKDVLVATNLRPHCLCIPKVESEQEIDMVNNLVSSSDKALKYPIGVFPLIETSKGYMNAKEILNRSNIITGTAVGVEDVMLEFNIERKTIWKNHLIRHFLIELSILSKCLDIDYIGPISRGYRTDEHLSILESECTYLKEIGATGKLAIHPRQLSTINRSFGALKVCAKDMQQQMKLFTDSKKRGYSVISLNGSMLDEPYYRRIVSGFKTSPDK